MQVAIRTQVDPSSLIEPVKRIVREMNPEVATKFTTMEAMVGESVADPRFRTTLAMSFAGARAPAGDHGCVRRDELS